MKNPLLLHDLLYIGEHQTCNHYRADVGSGFIYEELEAGETERLDTVRRNHLLILLEGALLARLQPILGPRLLGRRDDPRTAFGGVQRTDAHTGPAAGHGLRETRERLRPARAAKLSHAVPATALRFPPHRDPVSAHRLLRPARLLPEERHELRTPARDETPGLFFLSARVLQQGGDRRALLPDRQPVVRLPQFRLRKLPEGAFAQGA